MFYPNKLDLLRAQAKASGYQLYYVIMECENTSDLCVNINHMIELGWRPLGAPVFDGDKTNQWKQAMYDSGIIQLGSEQIAFDQKETNPIGTHSTQKDSHVDIINTLAQEAADAFLEGLFNRQEHMVTYSSWPSMVTNSSWPSEELTITSERKYKTIYERMINASILTIAGYQRIIEIENNKRLLIAYPEPSGKKWRVLHLINLDDCDEEDICDTYIGGRLAYIKKNIDYCIEKSITLTYGQYLSLGKWSAANGQLRDSYLANLMAAKIIEDWPYPNTKPKYSFHENNIESLEFIMAIQNL